MKPGPTALAAAMGAVLALSACSSSGDSVVDDRVADLEQQLDALADEVEQERRAREAAEARVRDSKECRDNAACVQPTSAPSTIPPATTDAPYSSVVDVFDEKYGDTGGLPEWATVATVPPSFGLTDAERLWCKQNVALVVQTAIDIPDILVFNFDAVGLTLDPPRFTEASARACAAAFALYRG
jgi:hypothetical protein